MNVPVRRIPPGSRVLLMIDRFLEEYHLGGTERQFRAIISALQSEGVDVKVCLLRGGPWDAESFLGCGVFFAEIDSLLSPRNWLRLGALRGWMKKQRFDAAQMFFRDSSWIGPWVAKSAGIPLVIGSRRNLRQWETVTYKFLGLASNRLVDWFIANSEAVKATAVSVEGISPDKIFVHYNGIDISAFRRDRNKRQQIRAQLGVAADQILVGAVANLRPIKGLSEFLAAAAKVQRAFPQTRFAVVGEGPLLTALQAQSQSLGLADTVFFCDMQRDIAGYLSAFDVAVQSSLAEGFSNAVLEYLANGLPVVATRVGGNEEAIADTGILVPPGDVDALAKAIEEVIERQSMWAMMGERARGRAQLFTQAAAANRLVDIYAEILSGEREATESVQTRSTYSR